MYRRSAGQFNGSRRVVVHSMGGRKSREVDASHSVSYKSPCRFLLSGCHRQIAEFLIYWVGNQIARGSLHMHEDPENIDATSCEESQKNPELEAFSCADQRLQGVPDDKRVSLFERPPELQRMRLGFPEVRARQVRRKPYGR